MSAAVYALWLQGIDPERMVKLPSVAELAGSGVDVRLIPLPLVGPVTCYYQTLTGIGPGKLGRFDAVYPAAYQACPETAIPEGAMHRLLPDLARSAGRTIKLVENEVALAGSALDDTSSDSIVLRLRDAAQSSDNALDNLVRRCAESAGTTGTVIVWSDSWSPAPRRLVNVNTFLAEAGLLETQTGADASREIAWAETLAYGLGAGQIWVNMRGREPQGIVNPGREYDDVRAALMDALRNDWRDPETNERVVAQVLTKEEAFAGEYLFKAPDLAVVYRPGYAPSPRAAALGLDTASVQSGATGATASAPAAEPAARLIGRGPALACGVTATGRLIDVVPSLLYLLGLPIPSHVDGQPLTDLFTPAFREQQPIRHDEHGAALTAEEEDVIVGRLQALGYLG